MLDLLCEEANRLKTELEDRLQLDRLNDLPSEESRRSMTAVDRRYEHRTIN